MWLNLTGQRVWWEIKSAESRVRVRDKGVWPTGRCSRLFCAWFRPAAPGGRSVGFPQPTGRQDRRAAWLPLLTALCETPPSIVLHWRSPVLSAGAERWGLRGTGVSKKKPRSSLTPILPSPRPAATRPCNFLGPSSPPAPLASRARPGGRGEGSGLRESSA